MPLGLKTEGKRQLGRKDKDKIGEISPEMSKECNPFKIACRVEERDRGGRGEEGRANSFCARAFFEVSRAREARPRRARVTHGARDTDPYSGWR